MNAYEESEKRGRTILYGIFHSLPYYRNFSVDNLEFTQGTFTRYDGCFTNGDKNCVFELKYRQNSIDRYPTYLMEKSKWDELAKHHQQGKTAYYIMIFNEADGTNSCYIFNISIRIKLWGINASGKVEVAEQPNSTVDQSRGRSPKDIIFLIPEDYDIRIDGYTSATTPLPFEDSSASAEDYSFNPWIF